MAQPFLVGYARVSTDEQDMRLQRDALIRYGVPSERIVEEKASGATVLRPKFKALVKAMRPGDALVVWKLDRLGRTLTGVLKVLEYLAENDVKFISITEGFDTKTPMGKAMLQVALVFAELERSMISERTKAGMAAARKAGKTFGRPHSIRDFPKRIAKLQQMHRAGELISTDRLLLMRPEDLMEILNKADRKAPPIGNVETVRRWVRADFPWIDEGEDDMGSTV